MTVDLRVMPEIGKPVPLFRAPVSSGIAPEAFDAILLATGFRAAMPFLGDLVQRDAKGFALRRDRVVSVDQPNLYFVGHNYDSTGGLTNIRQDAPRAAAYVKRNAASTQ